MKSFKWAILVSAFCILHSAFPQTILTAPGLASFKKKVASGGGGSGYTLIAHTAQSGTTGNTTSPAINTTGANLLQIIAIGSGATTPTMVDNMGNSGWTVATNASFSGGKNITVWQNISPASVGSGHTASIQSVSGFSVYFFAWAKAGGTPALDAISPGGLTANWQTSSIKSGSITPSTTSDLALSLVWFDVGTGVGDAPDSGFTALDSPVVGAGNNGGDAAYKILTTAAAVNVGWTRGTANNSDAFTFALFWK